MWSAVRTGTNGVRLLHQTGLGPEVRNGNRSRKEVTLDGQIHADRRKRRC